MSPSKPSAKSALAKPVVNDDDEREHLLSVLAQQQASLATLQEKKKRLEAAQAEVRSRFLFNLAYRTVRQDRLGPFQCSLPGNVCHGPYG